MTKASSVVASVTQQSRQRVPQSRTENRKWPKATWVQTVRRHDELMTSGGAWRPPLPPPMGSQLHRTGPTSRRVLPPDQHDRWQDFFCICIVWW